MLVLSVSGASCFEDAITFAWQVAAALAAAHAKGIIHRDLNPNDIMLCASAAASTPTR